MREILFRGKTENGYWVNGCYIEDDLILEKTPYTNIIRLLSGSVKIEEYLNEVIPSTIGQYTGLTDKNGTKIFEGDIIQGLFLFGMPINAVVIFQDGAFGLESYRGDVKQFSAFTSVCNVEYEVIGNIHDNPELLKGGAE